MRATARGVACLILSIVSLGPIPAHKIRAQGAQEIRISHHYDDANDARGRATRVFVEEVALRAPELKLRIYPKLSLGFTSVGQLEALQTGKLEMALYPFTYAAEKIPEASLALLPGLVPSLEMAHKLKSTAFHDKLQAIAEANGVRIITWWWSPGGFATKTRPIKGPETVSGLRMRAGDPIFERMLQAAGATPLQVPLPALRASLERGILDGVLTAYETFVALQLNDQLKFVTVGTPTVWMLFHPLLMAKPTWDRLTPEQQAAIEAAAGVAEAFFDSTQRSAELRLLKLARESGLEVHQLSTAEYNAWLALARRTAWADYLRLSPEAERLLLETMQIIMSEFDEKR